MAIATAMPSNAAKQPGRRVDGRADSVVALGQRFDGRTRERRKRHCDPRSRQQGAGEPTRNVVCVDAGALGVPQASQRVYERPRCGKQAQPVALGQAGSRARKQRSHQRPGVSASPAVSAE